MGLLDPPVNNASSTRTGKIQLAGDLGGTATNVTVKPIKRYFSILDYGAKADVKKIYDVATTANSPIITSSSAAFTSNDIGKVITIQQGDTLGVQATNTLTSDGNNVNDNDRVIIGDTTYRFKITPSQAYDVQIGTAASDTLSNIYVAINASGTSSNYFTGTNINPDVLASGLSSTSFTLTAKAFGALGNNVRTIRYAVRLSFAKSYMYGGLSGIPTKATIQSYQSTTQVTLNTNIKNTLSNAYSLYGTNATTATQNAVTAATAAGGGTIILPTGGVIFQSAVDIANNIFIEGHGQEVSTVYSNCTYDYVFRKRGTSGIVNFGFSNFTIDTNFAQAGSAIRVEYASRGLFENMRFINTGPNGWQVVVGIISTTDDKFRNFDIDFIGCTFDIITSTLEQLLFLNAARIKIERCRFLNQTIGSGPGLGLYQNINGADIVDCDFINCVGPAIYYSLSTNYINITGNNFYGPGNGIEGANLPDNGSFGYGRVLGLRVTNNYFTGCANGLQLGAAIGPIVKDNNFDQNILTGIRVNRGNNGVSALTIRYSISGNTFSHNNIDGTNSLIHPAILMEQLGGFMSGDISNNSFWNDESNRDQQYAITFSGAFVWDGINIHHNFIPNYNVNQTPLGYSGGATVGSNVVMRNNYEVNPEGLYDIGSISGTATLSRFNGDTITATLIANTAITVSPGKSIGDRLTIVVTQDSTGSRTATWTNVSFGQGGLTLSTAPNATDVIHLQWTGTIWRENARNLGSAQTLSGTAGGDLSGTYPNPTLLNTTNVQKIVQIDSIPLIIALG